MACASRFPYILYGQKKGRPFPSRCLLHYGVFPYSIWKEWVASRETLFTPEISVHFQRSFPPSVSVSHSLIGKGSFFPNTQSVAPTRAPSEMRNPLCACAKQTKLEEKEKRVGSQTLWTVYNIHFGAIDAAALPLFFFCRQGGENRSDLWRPLFNSQ